MAKSNRKRRTREHIIADLAVNHVERHVLRRGFTMHRIAHDYGIDAAISTYTKTGEIESGVIWMQLKATDSPQRPKKGGITIRVDRRDLLSWMGELYPMILVVYDATNDQACWLHVQHHLREGRVFALVKKGATATLQLADEQRVDEDAVSHWHQLKARSLAQW